MRLRKGKEPTIAIIKLRQLIREGMFGRPKYYIDDDLIRKNNQFGRVLVERENKNLIKLFLKFDR